ncbi:MAG: hypothetical protein PHE89_06255 [Alphaproteobacteria bacterium]|nr:hypothetical protein [Alphaproteobacteria bacterium]
MEITVFLKNCPKDDVDLESEHYLGRKQHECPIKDEKLTLKGGILYIFEDGQRRKLPAVTYSHPTMSEEEMLAVIDLNSSLEQISPFKYEDSVILMSKEEPDLLLHRLDTFFKNKRYHKELSFELLFTTHWLGLSDAVRMLLATEDDSKAISTASIFFKSELDINRKKRMIDTIQFFLERDNLCDLS